MSLYLISGRVVFVFFFRIVNSIGFSVNSFYFFPKGFNMAKHTYNPVIRNLYKNRRLKSLICQHNIGGNVDV